MSDHATVYDRHRRRLAKKQAATEHATLKFKVTTSGGLPVHKSTVNFGRAREMVREQAKAGRPVWVREVANAPVVILELWKRSTTDHFPVHAYNQGGIMPLPPGRIPTWCNTIHAEYTEHYPGGIL